MGYNDLLIDGEFGALPEEPLEILRRMEHSAWELNEIVNATLDVSRLDTGRLPLEIKKIDLLLLLEEVKQETENLRANSPLEFFWLAPPSIPPIFTDPMKVKVVLKSLISNAVKFTETGSVTVSVATLQDGVEINVTDTGIGVAPEARTLIFEPFRQAENPMTRKYGGIGLGLYIVRRMLELLRGTISVESTPGQGATFNVHLPFTIAEGLAEAPVN